MKYFFRLLLVFSFLVVAVNAQQLENIAAFNRASLAKDTLMPWYNPGVAANLGVRSVWVATEDLDNDGKAEVLATDYQNNGRVHVMEQNGDKLEIVWSSPKIYGFNSTASTPRWIRTGDLDGDGKGEIIFPIGKTTASDYELQVWEYNDADNQYQFAISLLPNNFSTQGVGNFRMSREVASVYDFDNDGSDELIMSNRDHRIYVLGISGDVPGFGGWVLEGGDPAVVPVNSNSFSISHWHSVPADLNGDGSEEIVNHMWNFLAFWTIKPTGVNTYAYPDTSVDNYYVEFLKDAAVDAVAFMGIQVVDVDGDGKDEIAGIQYSGASDRDYDPFLVSFNTTDDVMYGWDTTKFSLIGENLWETAGLGTGQFWGVGAADLNGNGKQEILLGGSTNYTVVSLEYNGTGSILDPANYTASVAYSGGHISKMSAWEVRDSLGTIDTVAVGDAPFVSKMFAGCDINGNGKQEVFLSYQSVFDSIKYTHKRWNGSAYVTDSTFGVNGVVMVRNEDQVTVRMLEATLTGIKEINLGIVTPEDYTLEQNYPNPFNPTTSIRFSLPLQKKISVIVYDILGNEVKTLINNQEFEKGNYEVTWDGTNNFGSAVASGQYIYTMKYGNFSKSLKMTLLK
ncbi:MAG: VCBS repeat-containing protein [Ignavibacteriaceae bacterium]|nr:VCBS repeat-containing protein [Ignavibacteriaceae bacterium]